MEKTITSTSNAYVKHLKKLQALKKYRDKEGCFVLEGERPVKDMLSYGIKPVKLILGENHKDFAYDGDVLRMTDNVMKYISDTSNPQNIMAEVKIPERSFAELLPEKYPLVVFSDGISDPGNLGTIIRTLDASGGGALVCGAGTVDLYNPKTIRSTMSSVFNVPSFTSYDNVKSLKALKNAGYKIIGTRMSDAEIYSDADFSSPSVIVMGSEAFGMSDDVKKMCDDFIKIPIDGKIESLNVAVAAGIIIYEARRKRKKL